MSQQNSSMGSLLDGSGADAAESSANPKRKQGKSLPSRDVWMMVAGLVGIVAALGILAFQLFGGAPTAADLASRIVMIDTESGQVFQNFRVRDGDVAPWENPATGRKTLVPAEACYWTKDGRAKLEPTFVLLNSYIGKEGDTLCPDCGRRVVGRNPMPPTNLMLEALRRSEP